MRTGIDFTRKADDRAILAAADKYRTELIDTCLEMDDTAMEAYLEAWDPHTYTDPDVVPLFEELRADGIRVGVLSNTMWPRSILISSPRWRRAISPLAAARV